MQDASEAERIRQRFEAMSPVMDERVRRQWAAAEAISLGWDGVSLVAAVTGMARNTIGAGVAELEYRREHPDEEVEWRVRSVGGGRKPLTQTNPELVEALVDPVTRGDPQSPLRWTCKSTAKLAEELRHQNHVASARTVAAMLKGAGYSLQANRKTLEGSTHPDRDGQFRYISKQVSASFKRNQPVVSVDTKKKELVGEFKDGGREWHPHGRPPGVKTHDFVDKKLGKAIPYGVYDLASNEGWVSVSASTTTRRDSPS